MAETRSPVPVLAVAAGAAVVVHAAIVATSQYHLGPHLSLGVLCKLGFVAAAALAHWSLYTSLLAGFALTLRPGHTALITTLARQLHGDIPEELAAYTRKVTIAWSGFFALQLLTSITLFCFAPLVVWSFFVNVLDLPLVAAMFAAEYAVRVRVLRDPPRHSFAVVFNMVSDMVRQARTKAPAAKSVP
jgi:uncharacterized membrane protein